DIIIAGIGGLNVRKRKRGIGPVWQIDLTETPLVGKRGKAGGADRETDVRPGRNGSANRLSGNDRQTDGREDRNAAGGGTVRVADDSDVTSATRDEDIGNRKRGRAGAGDSR